MSDGCPECKEYMEWCDTANLCSECLAALRARLAEAEKKSMELLERCLVTEGGRDMYRAELSKAEARVRELEGERPSGEGGEDG